MTAIKTQIGSKDAATETRFEPAAGISATNVQDAIELAAAVSWGAITGTIADQTDLQAALDAKLAVTAAASAYQPLDSDLTSWALITRASGFDTFATTPSSANLAALVSGETGTGALMFGTSPSITTDIRPSANDAASLGVSGTAFSDLFLASGGVINWGAGNATLTHSSGTLTASAFFDVTRAAIPFRATNTADLAAVNGFRVQGDRATPTAGDSIYSEFYLSDSAGTQVEVGRFTALATAVTAGAVTSYFSFQVRNGGVLGTPFRINPGSITPNASDGSALGTTALMWSDLFLASGGVINFNDGNLTMTHSAGALAITGVTTVASATATPAAGSTAARLLFGTTAGFGIYYGSGAPTVSAAQGSIYLRSDGSSTSTRLYVNTTGSTTWTNFTSST